MGAQEGKSVAEGECLHIGGSPVNKENRCTEGEVESLT